MPESKKTLGSEALLLNSYRARMAAHTAGLSTMKPIAFIVFGSGGHHEDGTPKSPDPEAVSLYKEVLRKPLDSIEQKDIYSVSGRGALMPQDAIGETISEAALADADGNLCGIKTFGPKTKEGDEIFTIELTIRY